MVVLNIYFPLFHYILCKSKILRCILFKITENDITTLSSNSQRFMEFKMLFLFSTLESLGLRFFFYFAFLFSAVHIGCAHIHTNCARQHTHKQTPIHVDTSTYSCTNAPSRMHSYLHSLTLARTCTFKSSRTHTCVHSQALTKQGLTHSLIFLRTQSQSHAPIHLHACAFAGALWRLLVCPYTLPRICTHCHSFMHTILHTRALVCTDSFVGYLTLPFSFSYVFVGYLTLHFSFSYVFAKRRRLPYFAY